MYIYPYGGWGGENLENEYSHCDGVVILVAGLEANCGWLPLGW